MKKEKEYPKGITSNTWFLENGFEERDETIEEQKKEIREKLVYEIEWHYEKEGELISLDDLIYNVDRDMHDEKYWTEEAFEYMEEIAQEVLEEEEEGIMDNIINMNAADPQAGMSFYDKHL